MFSVCWFLYPAVTQKMCVCVCVRVYVRMLSPHLTTSHPTAFHLEMKKSVCVCVREREGEREREREREFRMISLAFLALQMC